MAPPTKCECGECNRCKHRERMRRWTQRNRDKTRKWSLRYRANNLELVREKDRNRPRYTGNPEHARARRLVRDAVARGELVPQPCEMCGSFGWLEDGRRTVHAHHDDYSNPLSVRWLCKTHHGEVHRKAA